MGKTSEGLHDERRKMGRSEDKLILYNQRKFGGVKEVFKIFTVKVKVNIVQHCAHVQGMDKKQDA